MWVNVGISKSLCLCQVQPRLVPWCAKTVQTQPFRFLAKMVVPAQIQCFPSEGLPNTGPVLAQHWAEYWSSTGPVLGIILAQYCPSTVENRGHGLVQCWRKSKACLAHQKPNHCHQKMSYGECLNVFHMPTHKPACQGASSKAPLGILKMVAL